MSIRRRLDRLNHLHDGNGPTAADAVDDLQVTQAERDALPWNQPKPCVECDGGEDVATAYLRAGGWISST